MVEVSATDDVIDDVTGEDGLKCAWSAWWRVDKDKRRWKRYSSIRLWNDGKRCNFPCYMFDLGFFGVYVDRIPGRYRRWNVMLVSPDGDRCFLREFSGPLYLAKKEALLLAYDALADAMDVINENFRVLPPEGE